jgi:ribonuclease G
VRPSLFQSLTRLCEHCGGSGRIYTPASVLRRVERALVRAGADLSEKSVVVRVHPEVSLAMLEGEPDFAKRLTRRAGIEVSLRDDPLLGEDQFRLLAGPAATDVTDRYVVG